MKHRTYLFLLAITIVYIVYSFIRGYTDINISSIFTPLILLPFAIIHGSMYCGVKKMSYFFLLVFIVSVFYESVSVSSGFPFGHYYYSDRLGTKIFDVPLAIMPTYFSLGYVSWFISMILLNQFDKPIPTVSKAIIISLVASFVMVSWDVVMDPVNSLIKSLWVWTDRGVYFGVPLSNFFGWFLCVFTFYLPFTLWCYNDKVHLKQIPTHGYLYLPSIVYITIMSKYILCFLFKDSVDVTTLHGEVFSSKDVYGSVMLIGLFTMLPIGIQSIYKIYRHRNHSLHATTAL
ncbi:carotenoid biosynthesis protein [Vibrio tubiashii]|nr:carotenoid biosynthesis protein [Vibrio tubiashii]